MDTSAGRCEEDASNILQKCSLAPGQSVSSVSDDENRNYCRDNAFESAGRKLSAAWEHVSVAKTIKLRGRRTLVFETLRCRRTPFPDCVLQSASARRRLIWPFARMVTNLRNLQPASQPATDISRRPSLAHAPRRVRTVAYLAILLGGVAVVLVLPRWLFQLRADWAAVWLTHEDGPYEVLGALSVLAAAIVFGFLALARDPSHSASAPRRKWFLGLLAAALMLMFLEEMSWGERLFSLRVPQWFKRVNIQEELTLHNLYFFHPSMTNNRLKTIWLYGSIGFLGMLPILALLVPPLRTLLDRHCVPRSSWQLATATLFAFWFFSKLFGAAMERNDLYAAHDVGEAVELAIEDAFLVLAVELLVTNWRAGAIARLRPLLLGMTLVVLPLFVVLAWGFTKAAIDRDPTISAIAFLRRGSAQLAAGQTEEALASFERSLESWPEQVAPHLRIAEIAASRQDPQRAARHYGAVLTLQPDHSGARIGLALALRAQGRLIEATKELETAVNLNPHNAGAYNNLGVVLAEQRLWRQARECFAKAVSLDPNNHEARSNLQAAEQALAKQGA
jgi:tetratricopeptide (TPR) repeat protein